MYIDEQLTSGQTYFYRLSVTDTNDVESFPTDVQAITPASEFTYQSEDATHIGTVFVDNNHLGYHGTAFTNFDASNSTVEFTYMPGFGGGERTLIFRYALGNTDRTGNLIVNSDIQSLTMRGTGEWTNYVYDSVGVTLNAGYDNTISFAATGNDFGNLDEITIVPRMLNAIASEDDQNDIPTEFQLYKNYPNPFNPSTTIRYDLPQRDQVKLTIHNILGEQVKTYVNQDMPAGTHRFNVNMENLPSGIYFYTITTSNFIKSRKMVLIR
jgi:hypothetical protein